VKIMCLATLAVCASAVSGQISTVGPFAGVQTEGFETVQPNVLYECIPGGIFGGAAELCEPEHDSVVVPIGWALFCVSMPRTGQRYVVAIEAPIEITFDAPVRRFGGYFATVGGDDGGTVEFSGPGGPIGSATLMTNQCTYVWNGWESATPFTRVRIIGESAFSEGGYIHMDDLEYQVGGGGCYPNCDGSTTTPVLNVQDFTCFLQRYAAGEGYANCDQSTQAPTLNVQDFTCFLQRYAAGCN
jgi:hypothetical protein